MKIPHLSLVVICCVSLISINGMASSPDDTISDVRAWRSANEQAIVDSFVELLSIPNVASDTVNIRRNADHLVALFEARGFSTQLLESEGPPAVYAERKSPGAERTILVYIHYDGQPANAADWASDPWTPVLRTGLVEAGGREVPIAAPFDPEWRLFGRSTGDDKAPVIALLSAVDALESVNQSLGVNLKVFLEGEEEAGSPHLQEVLAENRELLQADLWLFCDGPMHQSRRLQLNYGVRGSYGFDVTVYGASRPLPQWPLWQLGPKPDRRTDGLASQHA